MKILAIHNGTELAKEILTIVDSDLVDVVDVTSPVMAVELLSARKDIDLVVISMASVWGGSDKWLSVVRACGKTLPCVFIPDTCEIAAISGVILNHHVVCPLNTVAGRKVFSTYVEGLQAADQAPNAPMQSRNFVTSRNAGNDFGETPVRKDQCTDKPRFTVRQKQILDLILVGKSNREIAADLKLAEGTVKVHSISIYRVLGVSNRVQAVLAAQQLAPCI